MRTSVAIGVLLLAELMVSGETVSAAEDGKEPNTRSNQGSTLEDIGRGVKSAAKNIEQEIPKIGAAIGDAVKKVTEKAPSRSTQDKPAKPTK